ncbi:thiopeptide-type bacteriocin biosynthesis protein [Chitinophaga rhizophila]|uniref:Thiopeptide-type bacteriocin biosynthesis protein n=1 Tax=Chitinophaga rhizophila TaxID=2866212 RepID=A0ABS7G5N0_9BACT|nr:thiopeptide-type bacteriocin biosynthesis protein [Chitinophaga rhizophila]MBW8682961.1 thiopeptide-type bacteriocin biosynthesis protein [Chitinophaga rhizophila]
MQYSWLSAHLFYTGDLRLLLQHAVHPFLQQTGHRAFFIRYWEHGQHIRLRLHIPAHTFPAVQSSLISAVKGIAGVEVQFIAYEPEIDRYGNEYSIGWAEDQFVASSRYVIDVLNTTSEWSVSTALLQALKMNMALLYAWDTSPMQQLDTCRLFIRNWLPRLYDRSQPAAAQEQYFTSLLEARFTQYAAVLLPAVHNLWEELHAGTAATPLKQFVACNRQVFCAYATHPFDTHKMQEITGSFLHMGHNRLGVSNLDEAYIMFFTLKCLQHVHARHPLS